MLYNAKQYSSNPSLFESKLRRWSMYHRVPKVLIQLSIVVFLIAGCTSTAPASQAPATVATQPPATSTTAPALPTDTAQPVHIKVGYGPFASYLPFYIAQQEGYFTEQGLDVELVPIAKQSDGMPLLVNGEIDIFSGQLDIVILNAIAQGGQLKIVADKGFEDPNGCTYEAWIARPSVVAGGKLDDLRNIKGLKVDIARTQTPEYALDLLLKPVGLSTADVQVVDLATPDRVAGIKNGSIDIAFFPEPYVTQLVNSGAGVIWKPFEQYMPNYQLGILMYGKSMLENKDAGQRFMAAYLKAVRQYMQGKTDQNVSLMSAFLKITPDVAKQSCWQPMRTDGSIDVQSVVDYQQWAVEKGYGIKTLEVNEFWDPSFVQYANSVLK
jgi:NitT/TauT family transport system substrate-binding protein